MSTDLPDKDHSEENRAVSPQIEESWKVVLADEFRKPYFSEIKQFLLEEKQRGNTVYPPGKLIFNAFDQTPFEEVKIVILGQDPYHGPRQAHGLCFSVPDGVRQPPSLQNIFKELHNDTGVPVPETGNLIQWAKQGVFLLNAILTVRAGQAASHHNIGWERFTDKVIQSLSDYRTGIIFILWGRYAQQKEQLIDSQNHYVLKAAHPSPFSANNGFFGCRHFSKANEILTHEGFNPIDWHIG